ncbi:hypothetical protein Y032_0036g3220 [Ancylostoma ceylanicum]|uniref:Thioredoxin-like fold domain-containing protein n=1 Tax=Ancylostoma ceylanicum TaxID=53326 RepID=A0A016UJP1_9BILA|nr:hypothetical protein Y032_0036g3220 [Ancylostoma ceylanicum]
MAELLKGVKLQKKDGSTADAEEVLKDKVVGLYFSAHWCPPCRQFTPVLKVGLGSQQFFEILVLRTCLEFLS